MLRTTREAAEILRLSEATLEAWRCRGGGPSYLKLGKAVRYPDESLGQFQQARMRTSTSSYNEQKRGKADRKCSSD